MSSAIKTFSKEFAKEGSQELVAGTAMGIGMCQKIEDETEKRQCEIDMILQKQMQAEDWVTMGGSAVAEASRDLAFMKIKKIAAKKLMILASKEASKQGMKIGTKVAAKIAARIVVKQVGTKIFTTVAKTFLKSLVAGPLGPILAALSFIGMILDIADVENYNSQRDLEYLVDHRKEWLKVTKQGYEKLEIPDPDDPNKTYKGNDVPKEYGGPFTFPEEAIVNFPEYDELGDWINSKDYNDYLSYHLLYLTKNGINLEDDDDGDNLDPNEDILTDEEKDLDKFLEKYLEDLRKDQDSVESTNKNSSTTSKIRIGGIILLFILIILMSIYFFSRSKV